MRLEFGSSLSSYMLTIMNQVAILFRVRLLSAAVVVSLSLCQSLACPSPSFVLFVAHPLIFFLSFSLSAHFCSHFTPVPPPPSPPLQNSVFSHDIIVQVSGLVILNGTVPSLSRTDVRQLLPAFAAYKVRTRKHKKKHANKHERRHIGDRKSSFRCLSQFERHMDTCTFTHTHAHAERAVHPLGFCLLSSKASCIHTQRE
jgi:hypothetical protein